MFLGLAPGGVGKVARCSLSNKKLDVWMDVCRLHEKLGMTPICLRARKNIIITYSHNDKHSPDIGTLKSPYPPKRPERHLFSHGQSSWPATCCSELRQKGSPKDSNGVCWGFADSLCKRLENWNYFSATCYVVPNGSNYILKGYS